MHRDVQQAHAQPVRRVVAEGGGGGGGVSHVGQSTLLFLALSTLVQSRD